MNMVNGIIRTLIAVILLFAINTKAAETLTFKQSIDDFMSTLIKEFDIKSATSIAVVKGDSVIYQQSFGYADIENQQPATNDTAFYIASITKPLFALTVLQTLENSKYDTSLSLQKMFPEIRFAKEIPANKITIQDLLAHTSGLDDNFLATAVSTSGIHSKKSKQLMLAQIFASKESQHAEFDYTNLGYNIISIWYEKTFNITWQKALEKTLFKPLNMSHSTAIVSDAERNQWLIAKPYSFFNTNPNKALYLTKQDNTMHAAGGVISSSNDMAQFIKLQLNAKTTDDSHLPQPKLINLSQQAVATLTSSRGDFERNAYAYGWYTGSYKNQLTYHHFGSFEGFRPHLSFMAEEKLGLVILNNEDSLNDKLTDLIADFIYSKLLAEKGVEQRINSRIAKLKTMAYKYRDKIASKDKSYTLKPWQLSAEKQSYVGKYHHPLAGDIRITFNDDTFELTWGNLKTTATPFREIDQMRVKFRPSNGQKVQFEIIDGKPTGLIYSGIKFSKENKLVELNHVNTLGSSH